MNVSIVIPVYNEADRLDACLRAIAAQTVQPHQIIVVDNNSTDETVNIARQFEGVTLLSEPKQGVLHARTTGFDVANGDIIARIDGDTLLPADWIKQLQAIFADNSVSAVSGSAHYYDFSWQRAADFFDGFFRGNLARQLGGTNFLWGANMALRRTDWLAIRESLCQTGELHEDFDLAIHLQAADRKVIYDASLLAGVSARRIDMDFLAFVRYTLKSPQTYAQHGLSSRRYMYPVVFACWLGYLPGRILYRGYDHNSDEFSWSRLLSLDKSRVDPTSNIV